MDDLSERPHLSARACRALGSLLEKERTVPATYPLTLNALVAACNQTSGRDPVLHLDDREVEAAVDELREAGLARVVHASHGARSLKYRQVAVERLGLDDPGRAVLTLLLLRGPQTVGELRARSERLHAFGAVDEVEAALTRLASPDRGLVVQLPRLAGHKERRWSHTLAGEPAVLEPGPPPPPAGAVELAPALAALAPLVGRWEGRGAGFYPTIDDFAYTEELDIRPVPGKPLLSHHTTTRAADDGRALHTEAGFWRVVPASQPVVVELVLATGSGLVEAGQGLVVADATDGDTVVVALNSTTVLGTPTAKSVTATARRYRVSGDTLTYDVDMAAVGQPLAPHLHATLTRHGR